MEPNPIWQLPPDCPEAVEPLGSKDKFWFEDSSSNRWLFKYARQGTGEAWAEKIAEGFAGLLELPHAVIELAVFNGGMGSASKSFLEPGVDLIHGSEVLAGLVTSYDRRKKRDQRDHCLANVFRALQTTPTLERERALLVMAGYLVLDAVIVNVDRHHDNWGLLRRVDAGNRESHEIAPTFDHASSLGRELRDERRERYLREDRVRDYVLRGSGGIYLSGEAPQGENPLRLVEEASSEWTAYFKPWLSRLRDLEDRQFEAIINSVPDDWMGPTAKGFSYRMVQFTLSRLRSVPA